MMKYPVIDMASTGDNIKALRKEKKLRVTDIRNYMGIQSEQAIYKWERGESLPTVDNLLALSSLLETSIEDILSVKYI